MILYHQWLSLPIQTRIKIASDFGIIKKGSTHVVNNEIQSDGYSVKDVELALNTEAIQKYVNMPDESNMKVLWIYLVDKAEGREFINIPKEIVETLTEKKPTKNAKKNK